MIVVDTNIIAWLYLPTDRTQDAVALLNRDVHWVAPQLWRSEFRNVLALYLRKRIIDLGTAMAMQAQSERQMAGSEYTVSSTDVLALVAKSNCSAYDCEFVSLAQALGTKLFTGDRKLIEAFPDIALEPGNF